MDLPPSHPYVTFTAAYPGLAGCFSPGAAPRLSLSLHGNVLPGPAWQGPGPGLGCCPLVVPPCSTLLKLLFLSNRVVCMFQLDTKMFSSLPQLPCQLS